MMPPKRTRQVFSLCDPKSKAFSFDDEIIRHRCGNRCADDRPNYRRYRSNKAVHRLPPRIVRALPLIPLEVATLYEFTLFGKIVMIYGRPRMRRMMASKSEKCAAWVTAIATALQTIAVSAKLFVVYKEWSAHERQSLEAKRDQTLKISDNNPSLDRARAAIRQYDRCHRIKRQNATSLSNDDKEYLNSHCSTILLDDDTMFGILMHPFTDYLDRAVACLRADLCDRQTVSDQFCDDAKLLHTLLLATAAQETGSLHRSDFPGIADFICTR
jgi:hypothetical protein